MFAIYVHPTLREYVKPDTNIITVSRSYYYWIGPAVGRFYIKDIYTHIEEISMRFCVCLSLYVCVCV